MQVIRRFPSTIAIPALILIILLAISIYGIEVVANSYEQSTRVGWCMWHALLVVPHEHTFEQLAGWPPSGIFLADWSWYGDSASEEQEACFLVSDRPSLIDECVCISASWLICM